MSSVSTNVRARCVVPYPSLSPDAACSIERRRPTLSSTGLMASSFCWTTCAKASTLSISRASDGAPATRELLRSLIGGPGPSACLDDSPSPTSRSLLVGSRLTPRGVAAAAMWTSDASTPVAVFSTVVPLEAIMTSPRAFCDSNSAVPPCTERAVVVSLVSPSLDRLVSWACASAVVETVTVRALPPKIFDVQTTHRRQLTYPKTKRPTRMTKGIIALKVLPGPRALR